MNIRSQIERAEGELFDLLAEIEIKRKHIKQLRAQRDGCFHVWDKPLKNYEHEGCRCMKCGINSLEIGR